MGGGEGVGLGGGGGETGTLYLESQNTAAQIAHYARLDALDFGEQPQTGWATDQY